MKEELKGSEVDNINKSVNEVPKEITKAEENYPDNSGIRNKLIMISAGILVACIFVWLLVGKVESSYLEDDNNNLQKDLDKKDALLQEAIKRNEDLTHIIESLSLEMEGIRNKNAQLHIEITRREEVIDELKGKVAEEDVENEKLKTIIKELNDIIEDQKNEMEAQKLEIENLKDDLDELNSDLHLIVGITNQELNRNQALIKEIDALDDKIKDEQKLIGKLETELFQTREKLYEEQSNNAIQWLQLNLLERKTENRVKVTQVYAASKTDCDSRKFYDLVKDLRPNLFIATEDQTNLMFGGYTAQSWENTTPFKSDDKAFTFSISHKKVCEIIDQEYAIYTNRNKEGKDLLLTFGNFDITLNDKCLATTEHLIKPNQNYKCPESTSKYFYTENEHPQLSAFRFYTVEFEKL